MRAAIAGNKSVRFGDPRRQCCFRVGCNGCRIVSFTATQSGNGWLAVDVKDLEVAGKEKQSNDHTRRGKAVWRCRNFRLVSDRALISRTCQPSYSEYRCLSDPPLNPRKPPARGAQRGVTTFLSRLPLPSAPERLVCFPWAFRVLTRNALSEELERLAGQGSLLGVEHFAQSVSSG